MFLFFLFNGAFLSSVCGPFLAQLTVVESSDTQFQCRSTIGCNDDNENVFGLLFFSFRLLFDATFRRRPLAIHFIDRP